MTERHTVGLKLTPEEFRALSDDAKRSSVKPTTLVLCHVLAGTQRQRQREPDLTLAIEKAAGKLADAARRLRGAGMTAEAEAAERSGREVMTAVATARERERELVSPGWQLAAYRHRIEWDGEDAGRPRLDGKPGAPPRPRAGTGDRGDA